MVDLKDEIVVDVNARHFCIALTRSGKIYSWGNNVNWELGRSEDNCDPNPNEITYFPASTKIVKIAAGPHHSLAISSNGE